MAMPPALAYNICCCGCCCWGGGPAGGFGCMAPTGGAEVWLGGSGPEGACMAAAAAAAACAPPGMMGGISTGATGAGARGST